jgi:hypothetical protein
MQAVELYRREAARLTNLAHGSSDRGIEAELLDIAARFLCLAEFRANGRTSPVLDEMPSMSEDAAV